MGNSIYNWGLVRVTGSDFMCHRAVGQYCASTGSVHMGRILDQRHADGFVVFFHSPMVDGVDTYVSTPTDAA